MPTVQQKRSSLVWRSAGRNALDFALMRNRIAHRIKFRKRERLRNFEDGLAFIENTGEATQSIRLACLPGCRRIRCQPTHSS